MFVDDEHMSTHCTQLVGQLIVDTSRERSQGMV